MIYVNNKGIALQELTYEDEKELYELLCDEDCGLQHFEFSHERMVIFTKYMFFYLLWDKVNDKCIGYVNIKRSRHKTPEIGMYLREEYRNKGIATEFLPKAGLAYAKENEVEYFEYRSKFRNKASLRVADKLGAIKLEDEGDALYDAIMELLPDLPPEKRERHLKDLEDYDAEQENVIKFKWVLNN